MLSGVRSVKLAGRVSNWDCSDVQGFKFVDISETMAVFGLALMTLLLLLPASSYTQEHYVGELPDGYDVLTFLNICSVCGEFYGGQMERNCIFDKTFETFNNCKIAVMDRRRK